MGNSTSTDEEANSTDKEAKPLRIGASARRLGGLSRLNTTGVRIPKEYTGEDFFQKARQEMKSKALLREVLSAYGVKGHTAIEDSISFSTDIGALKRIVKLVNGVTLFVGCLHPWKDSSEAEAAALMNLAASRMSNGQFGCVEYWRNKDGHVYTEYNGLRYYVSSFLPDAMKLEDKAASTCEADARFAQELLASCAGALHAVFSKIDVFPDVPKKEHFPEWFCKDFADAAACSVRCGLTVDEVENLKAAVDSAMSKKAPAIRALPQKVLVHGDFQPKNCMYLAESKKPIIIDTKQSHVASRLFDFYHLLTGGDDAPFLPSDVDVDDPDALARFTKAVSIYLDCGNERLTEQEADLLPSVLLLKAALLVWFFGLQESFEGSNVKCKRAADVARWIINHSESISNAAR